MAVAHFKGATARVPAALAAFSLARLLTLGATGGWPTSRELSIACREFKAQLKKRYLFLFERPLNNERYLETFLVLSWRDPDFNPGWYTRWRYFSIRYFVILTVQFEQVLRVLRRGSKRDVLKAIARCELLVRVMQDRSSGQSGSSIGLSSMGGKARAQKYAPLREMARSLATARVFQSRRHAALSIANEIVSAAPLHGLRLSPLQAERTISNWIAGIPFASKRTPASGR